jgi:hypothetical protein
MTRKRISYDIQLSLAVGDLDVVFTELLNPSCVTACRILASLPIFQGLVIGVGLNGGSSNEISPFLQTNEESQELCFLDRVITIHWKYGTTV